MFGSHSEYKMGHALYRCQKNEIKCMSIGVVSFLDRKTFLDNFLSPFHFFERFFSISEFIISLLFNTKFIRAENGQTPTQLGLGALEKALN